MRMAISGIDDLAAALHETGERLKEAYKRGVEMACVEVESAAKEICPKDTNALRQSIMHKVDYDAGGAAHGIVGSDNEHAIYVHEGTGIHSRTGRGRKDVPWTYHDETGFHKTDGIEPTPFLEDARNEKAERVAQIIAAEAAQAVGG